MKLKNTHRINLSGQLKCKKILRARSAGLKSLHALDNIYDNYIGLPIEEIEDQNQDLLQKIKDIYHMPFNYYCKYADKDYEYGHMDVDSNWYNKCKSFKEIIEYFKNT